MARTDRRAQRTQARLQRALIELLRERGYDAITVQDIVDRADVGRTTFYQHYRGKDDLFVHCHEAMVSRFSALSPETLFAPDAPAGMMAAYRHLAEVRTLLSPLFQGRAKDSPLVLRRLRDQLAQRIAASLRAALAGADSALPIEVVAVALAGAQIALVQWWLERRQPYTPETVARTFHRLQRAVLREALALQDRE